MKKVINYLEKVMFNTLTKMWHHCRLISKTLEYVEARIAEKPEMLSYGNHSADVRFLSKHLSKLRSSHGLMGKKVRSLQSEVAKHVNKQELLPQAL